MEKVLMKIIITLIVFILIILGVKYMPLGTKKARLGASLISIDVPKLSSLDSECCEYEATFKTIRSKKKKKKELDSIMSNYQKVNCNGNTYYYDSSNNITYTKYETFDGLFSTKFKLVYVKNNICEM